MATVHTYYICAVYDGGVFYDWVHTGALFQDVLPVALLIPERVPRNKMLRARFISYLHRMVECLGAQVHPFLPQALAALLPRDCDTVDVTTALRLLNQLIAKFPQDLVAMLQELVPSVVVKCVPALESVAVSCFLTSYLQLLRHWLVNTCTAGISDHAVPKRLMRAFQSYLSGACACASQGHHDRRLVCVHP